MINNVKRYDISISVSVASCLQALPVLSRSQGTSRRDTPALWHCGRRLVLLTRAGSELGAGALRNEWRSVLFCFSLNNGLGLGEFFENSFLKDPHP